MITFFVLLLVASIVALITGLIKPSLFKRLIKNPTRKLLSLVFSLVIVGSFVGVGMTSPEPEPNPVGDALRQEQTAKKQENKENGQREILSEEDVTEIATPTKPQELREVMISRVVDGDTIITSEGERIRYIGIDTPETVHPYKKVEFYGKEASNKNKELVSGKTVELENDVSETDRYGRTLAYVWLGDEMINAKLVEEGFAYAYTYPPDVKYSEYFVALQYQARAQKVGLWINEEDEESIVPQETQINVPVPTSSTSQPSAVTPPASNNVESSAPVATNDTCDIKGNVSIPSGEKIYHVPGGASYNATKIDPDYGERWFCSESEAVAAGWRKAKR